MIIFLGFGRLFVCCAFELHHENSTNKNKTREKREGFCIENIFWGNRLPTKINVFLRSGLRPSMHFYIPAFLNYCTVGPTPNIRHSPPIFRGFIEKIFPWEVAPINFGQNIQPMETLTHIIGSLDIFQIILSVFPQIFNPLAHAFQSRFIMLRDIAGEQFASHPGIISGTIIFSLAFAVYSGLSKLQRTIISTRNTAANEIIPNTANL